MRRSVTYKVFAAHVLLQAYPRRLAQNAIRDTKWGGLGKTGVSQKVYSGPSDDEEASETESTLDFAKDKSFNTPSAEKHVNWGEMSKTQRRNWLRVKKKKLSAMGGN